MFPEAQTFWASKYFFKNWLGVRCYPPGGKIRTKKANFFWCSVLASWRVTPNTNPFLKKRGTSGIKTIYMASDIGSRIIHGPSCEKKSRKKCVLSIFKMKLNAQRCSVLAGSTVQKHENLFGYDF